MIINTSLSDLENKVLNVIQSADAISKFTSMPRYANTVSCQNYEIGRIRLEKPNNGCTSFKVFIDDTAVGRIERDIIEDPLYKSIERIKKGLIESL